MKTSKKQLLSVTCILVLFAILSVFILHDNKNKTISKTGFYFDTVITITIYNGDEKLLDNCFKMCEKYENLFSSTIPDSDISKINNNSKNGIATTVSDETLELINDGLKYCQLSEGAFDITIGSLSSIWNFTDNYEGILPSSQDIRNAISSIDYKQIYINNNDILLTNPDASIDTGGIAKGYIADRLKEYLTKNGVKSGIINLGGNVLLIGSKPDKSNYNIGVQRPFGDEGDSILIINDHDISIVTSGIYERYFYKDNIVYHHILDTKTGYPIENNLYSVTIISDKSVDGDALSTCAFALGLDAGMEFIENLENVEAIFIDNNENIFVTSGLVKDENIIKRKSKIPPQAAGHQT